MSLTIDIKGRGIVDKVVDLNTATLTATPDNGWGFKNYLVESEVIKDNPYSFEITSNTTILATFYVPIESYLKGKVGFDVTDDALVSLLLDRNVESESDVAELTTKQKDLLYADLLMWAATRPSSYTGSKESDDGWSHTEGGSTLLKSDKERFEDIANNIYDRYDDPKKAQSDIRIINLC